MSGCAAGLACRYDGTAKPHLLKHLPQGVIFVPLCPEQAGGLGTPRPRAMLRGGDGQDVLDGRARVINEEGRDVSREFLRGAQEALYLAELLGIREAFLVERSPSCGVNRVWIDGELRRGMGVAAALLHRAGVRVMGLEE